MIVNFYTDNLCRTLLFSKNLPFKPCVGDMIETDVDTYEVKKVIFNFDKGVLEVILEA